MRRFALFVLSSCLLMSSAQASPVTIGFTGSVTDDPFGLSYFGAPISGTYTYDSAAVDGIPGPATASYASVGMPYGFRVTVDGTTYTVDGNATIDIANNIGVDQYGIIATFGGLTLELLFQDATQTALSSDALPTTAPSLAAFSFVQFQLFSDDAQFNGTVDTLSCVAGCTAGGGGGGGTVPEPPALGLVGLGAVALVARRRARRSARPATQVA